MLAFIFRYEIFVYMRSIQSNAKPGNTAKEIVKIHVPKG